MKNKALIICILCAVCCMLNVQAQELLNYPLDTVNGEEVYKYEVERSIGLYRIGVNFNVAQNEIVRLNPQLRDRGLHYGETLLIPTGRKVERVKTKVESTPVKEESQESKVESQEVSTPVVADSAAVDSVVAAPAECKVVELALMLPFESQMTKRSVTAERMMAFYEGALLALHDLQNDSTLYRLRVYDSERSERKVLALCDSTELDNVRGVIGLVYPIQIERMAEWCEAHNVPLLLPFCDDMNLARRPHVLQFNSTDEQESDSLCQWISKQKNVHCVSIAVSDAEVSGSMRTLRNKMQANRMQTTDLALRDLMVDSATYALDKSKENLIIFHSDRFQHVRILLPHLIKLQDAGYKIRIVSQFSWQKEEIALPQVYTSVFTADTDRSAYEDLWSKAYSIQPANEMPRYDLLGYDLMQALVGWLDNKKESNGLQSVIRWQQVGKGGYQNACVKVLAY